MLNAGIMNLLAASQAPATISEWWAQYGKMLTDGIWGTNTSKAMQKFLGVSVDGERGPETVKAWQKWCNSQL